MIVAFTIPKNSFVNYYRFTYQLLTYTKAQVERECVDNWGVGTLVTSLTDFSPICNSPLVKACQIIVPETSVVDDGSGNKRMLTVDCGDPVSGNNVEIEACLTTMGGFTYYVCGGTNKNVLARKNRN